MRLDIATKMIRLKTLVTIDTINLFITNNFGVMNDKVTKSFSYS